MKCPKCKTGIMVPENDFDGREISRGCLICGERTYTQFTIRQPAATESNGEGARIGNSRRYFTPEELAFIRTKYAAGMTHQIIAQQLKRPVGSISKFIQKIRKEAKPLTSSRVQTASPVKSS